MLSLWQLYPFISFLFSHITMTNIYGIYSLYENYIIQISMITRLAKIRKIDLYIILTLYDHFIAPLLHLKKNHKPYELSQYEKKFHFYGSTFDL